MPRWVRQAKREARRTLTRQARPLRDLRFHDLRHEATSRLFEHGLNLMEVAAIMGHKTPGMLRRYYSLKIEDLAELERLVGQNRELIVRAWHEFFG